MQFFVLFALGHLTDPVFCQSAAGKEAPVQFKRLILTDGSYESIGGYSIEGDRVRYYSTERHDWEELPYSLIDWAATRAYAGRAAREAVERKQEALDRASEEREEEESRAPSVAPGMRLPSPDGVFLLDTFQNQPELSQLFQNGADLKKNLGGNILRSIINPLSGSRQTVELNGPRARIQAHVLIPVIYFSIDPNDALRAYSSESAKDHLRIVQCREKDGKRVVFGFEIAVYGKVALQAKFVDAIVEPVSRYWVRITPLAPLEPGEYALVEMIDQSTANSLVWDFGVDPAAAPNRAVERQSIGRQEPVLIEKPAQKEN